MSNSKNLLTLFVLNFLASYEPIRKWQVASFLHHFSAPSWST